MTKMKQVLGALLLLTLSMGPLQAQPRLHQVVLISGGSFSNPNNKVKMYSYMPASKKLTAFDSIPGTYTNDAVIENEVGYLTVGGTIYKYNLNTYARVDSLKADGVKRLVLHNDWLVVGKWFGAANKEYFSVYKKNDFSHVYTEKSITGFVPDLVIVRDTAYVLYNVTGVSGNDTSKVAIISLTGTTPSLVKTQLIGTYNLGLERIIATGNMLHLFSSAYSFPAVTVQWDMLSNNRNVYTLSNAGTPVLVEDSITLGGFGSGFVRLNPTTGYKQLLLNRTIAKGQYDSLNKHFYLVHTDFVNPDWIYVSDRSSGLQDSFQVGMSTEAIAFDYRITSGVAEKGQVEESALAVYPNPASDYLRISGQNIRNVKILNVSGQVVYASSAMQTQVDVTALPSGLYLIQAEANGLILRGKFIRK